MRTHVFPLLVSLALSAPLRAEPSVYPTGVTVYDPALAYGTYVIFGAPDHRTHLIDMDGNVVREWPYAGFPSELLDPGVTGGKLGHVLVQLSTVDREGAGIVPHMPAEFRNRTIGELDWDGNVVWHSASSRRAARRASITTGSARPMEIPWCWRTPTIPSRASSCRTCWTM